jgi:hypothetical protein
MSASCFSGFLQDNLCVLNQDGEMLLHRNMPAGPEPFLKAIPPYRVDLVVCVECTFTQY